MTSKVENAADSADYNRTEAQPSKYKQKLKIKNNKTLQNNDQDSR